MAKTKTSTELPQNLPGRLKRSSHLLTLIVAFTLSITAMNCQATVVQANNLASVEIGPKGELLLTGGLGVILSTDGGKSWTNQEDLAVLASKYDLSWIRINNPNFKAVRDSGGRLYRCTENTLSVEFSDDEGGHWTSKEVLDKRQTNHQELQQPGPLRRVKLNGRMTTIRTNISLIADLNGEMRDKQEIMSSSRGIDDCRDVNLIGNTLYALGSYGLYWSKDRGERWKGRYHNLREGFGPTTHYLFGDAASNIYINHTSLDTGDRHMLIYKSVDQGITWSKTLFDLANQKIQKNEMALLYLENGVFYFLGKAANSENYALYKSSDGKSSKKLLEFDRQNLEYGGKIVDIRGHQIAVVGIDTLYISDDDGIHWKKMTRGVLNLSNSTSIDID